MFVPKAIFFKISIPKKEAGIYCCAYSCKNKPSPKKAGLCSKHYHIHRRIKDPVYDRFVNFRGNAAKRPWKGGIGIPFSITLNQFREFCEKTGYIIKKGMRGRNCSIDRIRNWEGYHIDNIQIKSIQANVRKYHDHDKHFTELPETDEDYLPF